MEKQKTTQRRKGIDLKIGIVTSLFNSEIAKIEFDSCIKTLENKGISKEKILAVKVPGALEIPLALKKMASKKEFHALVAFGVVIRGETFHFEIVSLESASGIMSVSLDFEIPIANGILTVENIEQAYLRAEKKGIECALVVIDMLNSLEKIKNFSYFNEQK